MRARSALRSGPVGPDAPDAHLVGIEVDRGVGVDEDVVPDAPVVLGEAGHRLDHPLVEALHPVAGRLVAQRRVFPDPVVVELDLVALVVEQPHQAGVRDRHVVALEVVVDHDLPVGGLGGGLLGLHLEPLEPVTLHALRQPGDLLRQRGRVKVEVHEDEAGHDLDAGREQPQRGLVETRDRAAFGHADQLAVEAIGPAVVAAADRLAAIARAAQEARAAMAADVAERAQLALVVAQDQNRLHAGLGGDVAARARELADVAGELPGAGEDLALLDLEHRGVAVETGRESAAGMVSATAMRAS